MSCRWCGKTFAEHLDRRAVGAPVPRVPCVLLKAHYLEEAYQPTVVMAVCNVCGVRRPRDMMIVTNRPIPPAHVEITVRCRSCEDQIRAMFPPMPALTAILADARREDVEANPSIVLGED